MDEQDISYLYDKVISKAKYDEEHKQYMIRRKDYINLNLSKRQMRLLAKMCKNSGIYLEYKKRSLESYENSELFEEYNEIKIRISKCTNPNELTNLERKRIELRNLIVELNSRLVREILNNNISGLQQMKEKEEIYQIGYESLIHMLDNYNITKKGIFNRYLSKYLLYAVYRKILLLTQGTDRKRAQEISLLVSTKDNLPSSNLDNTIKTLSEILGIKEKKVRNLLNQERLLQTISIDEQVDLLDSLVDSDIETPLLSQNFEEEIFTASLREIILSIVETLPNKQPEVLKLNYGFEDGECHTLEEISKMYGVSKTRTTEIKKTALENLRISSRAKYLVDFYVETNSQNELLKQPVSKKTLVTLEEILIGLLPQEELLEYVSHLSCIERKFMMLYYGLQTEKRATNYEIQQLLKIRPKRFYEIKERALMSIREQILKKYSQVKENPTYLGYHIDESYLDLLMRNHLKRTRKKI